METSRRTSTRQRKAAQDSDAAAAEPAAGGSSDEDETAAVVEGALLAGRKKLSGTTRSARERAELAKTTRVLKSRLELALFKVGRGWEGVRFERIEAAHSQQCGSDTTSSSVDLGDDLLEASSSGLSKHPCASSSSSSSRTSASAHAGGAAAGGSTANWLERSAGQQEQLNSSMNGAGEDANKALLPPIEPSANATAMPSSTPRSTRQARSASTASMLGNQAHADSATSPSAAKTASAASLTTSATAHVPPTRPATTRPTLATPTASLDCNPGPASARPRSDSNITAASSSGGPMSAPPTTTTFSSPVAGGPSNAHEQEEFATPATASRLSKRQRRESHQPRSSSKRQHDTILEEGSSPPAPSSSGAAAPSSALSAAHLGHKRKISQNTLWHQSRAILSGIGGAPGSTLSPASQPTPFLSSNNSNSAFSAAHPSPQGYLNGQNAASLTSPVRLKPGQQRPHGTPQDGQQQAHMHSSPYGNMQQSPQGYIMANQSSSVSPAGSSSGGTVRGPATLQTPRRPSVQMMQNAPHTIASSHHSHHQYMPHHPSNLGMASAPSGQTNGNNVQMQQFSLNQPSSSGMMQQLSQQGQIPQPQQQQQGSYAFQSSQSDQQPDYAYALYSQQPHIMQTPQHGQSTHVMQHPHTAPQLHHPQQQHQQAMLTVNGYTTDYSGSDGMNVFGYGDSQPTMQSQLSPSYPQQQQQQQMQNAYGNQMSPLNMSNGFKSQQSQPGSTQMGQTMSMQGLPSQQPPQQHQNLAMMRSQSAISHAPSDMPTYNVSQPPPLDPSLLTASSGNNGGSQDPSSIDSNFSHQSVQAAQIVAARMANGPSAVGQQAQQAGTRPGTASGPERETAAELMLYLAASPSPQQPSKKVGNTALGGGDLSQVKGRKLFGNEDDSSHRPQLQPQHHQSQPQRGMQVQQQLSQQQQSHRNSVSSQSQTSAGSGTIAEMSKSQSQMGMQQDHNNPFAVQHTYPGMNDQNAFAPQQSYSSNGSTDMQAAAHLAQPFEYNQAMQFDPYTMMTSQGVTLDQEFGSGW